MIVEKAFAEFMMEKSLEKHLEETFKLPGVSGVIVTDQQGLCLGAKGTAKSNIAGPLSNIARQAEDLRKLSNAQTSPSICIESEAGCLLIGPRDNVTMAIFKSD